MKSKINSILEDIEKKKKELLVEYNHLMDKYGFSFKKGKIIFSLDRIMENKRLKKPIIKTIFTAKIREIISIPFIYSMVIPSLFLDLMLFIYQQTAFRLYNIPIVKRSEYIFYDRNQLDYLNIIQKVNCIYCSYFNGLMSYAVEIGGRTERYWCPIKHAKKINGGHQWQRYFADYGDPNGFKDTFYNMDKVNDFRKEKRTK